MARIFSVITLLVLAMTLCACDVPRNASWGQEGTRTNDRPNSKAERLYHEAMEAMAEHDDTTAALAKIIESFEQGLDRPSRVLADPAFDRIRNDLEQRKKLREALGNHVRESSVVMVDRDEPGEPMQLELELVDVDGKPVTDAVVYAYHTDAQGDYSPEAEQAGGGSDNPRLFCFARADDQGRVQVRSIVPAPYRGTTMTQHIHFHVLRTDKRPFGSGIYLGGNAELDEELKQEAADGRISLAQLTKEEGQTRVYARIQVPLE